MSNWQIFGSRKCSETRKAERFLKSLGLKFQLIDLKVTPLSKGELSSIRQAIPLQALIDTESAEYKKQNLQYMVHDIETKLLAHPLLLKTPVVRLGKRATVGYAPETWKQWLADA